MIINGRYKLKKVFEVGNRTVFEQVNQHNEFYNSRYIVAHNVKYPDEGLCRWGSGVYDLTLEGALALLESRC